MFSYDMQANYSQCNGNQKENILQKEQQFEIPQIQEKLDQIIIQERKNSKIARKYPKKRIPKLHVRLDQLNIRSEHILNLEKLRKISRYKKEKWFKEGVVKGFPERKLQDLQKLS